jgi:hypothetical protein
LQRYNFLLNLQISQYFFPKQHMTKNSARMTKTLNQLIPMVVPTGQNQFHSTTRKDLCGSEGIYD